MARTCAEERRLRLEAEAQVARLEQRIAEKDTLLRSLLEDGRLSAPTHDNIRAALSSAGEGGLPPELREQDIEAALCFVGHSKKTHENWVQWLSGGGDASPEAGDLEHHQECVKEYEHIEEVLLSALERLEVK